MKALWISPTGVGAPIASRVRAANHQVVGYGAGLDVPLVEKADLFPVAQVADLLVVDGPFPLVRTAPKNHPPSWRPSDESLFVEELRRHHDKIALGPTPTMDLLVGDPRYLRKWCARLDLPFDPTADGEPWSVGSWFTRDGLLTPGPYLDVWRPLFTEIRFRGWFELRGVVDANGPVIRACSAEWPVSDIPDGQEAEFLRALCS